VTRLTRRYHIPSAVRRSPLRVDADAARRLTASGALLIDVRRHEDRAPTLAGAVRIPPDEIPAALASFARQTPIVLACT
jgi:rhodanese-related sulfurtransferase